MNNIVTFNDNHIMRTLVLTKFLIRAKSIIMNQAKYHLQDIRDFFDDQ